MNENEEVLIASTHFMKRTKKRVCNKLKNDRYLDKVLKKGLTLKDTEVRPRFNKYLKTILSIKGYTIIIYNRHIILYAEHCNVAVTILNIPREFYSTVESLKKRKELQ